MPAAESDLIDLPGDWLSVRLASLLREGLRNGHSARESTGGDGVRTLTLTAVTRRDFSLANTKVTVADPVRVKDLWLHRSDIFIERANTAELVGLAALYDGPDDFAIFPDLLVRVRLSLDVADPYFVALQLLTDRCRRYFTSNAKGTAGNMPKIDHMIIGSTPLALPPLPEQRAIAHVLRAVQRAKEAAEAVVAAARQLKRSLLRHLFTSGPVPVDRADRVPLKETEIGPIPEHWEVTRIGEIAKVGNGSTPSRSTPAYWDGGTLPWLTSGKIHERVIRYADEFVTPTAQAECHLPIVKKGSVLVAITGQGKTLGNAAMIDLDTCVSQHLAYIQPYPSTVHSDYLLEYLGTRYDHFRQAANAGGSTKGALTCGYLKGYPLPLPPVAEQQRIGCMAAAVDAKIRLEQSRVSALGELFRSLLRDLMTGRVRVHELDLGTTGGRA